MSKAWLPFYFTVAALLGYFGHMALERDTPARTCPQIVRELEHSERRSEMHYGWYWEERTRAAELRSMVQELLRERGLPDNVPELPPQRDAAP